jgi:hypothetical protein
MAWPIKHGIRQEPWMHFSTLTSHRHALNRVLRNKHQAVSQGVQRFEKRSIFEDM